MPIECLLALNGQINDQQLFNFGLYLSPFDEALWG
jgi:hypothetical protein